MCLYPRLVQNPKYKVRKNGGNVPVCDDKRKEFVPIGCGKCYECRKEKANSWSVRLVEDVKVNKNGYFVTFTISDESMIELIKDVNEVKELKGYELDNRVAKLAVKRFRERWRKKYKKSIRHWLVTELGQKGTERLHIHGIVWTDESKEEITEKWGYGHTFIGSYLDERTARYCVKYLHKVDKRHKNYQSIILTSPGIGKAYLSSKKISEHRNKKRDYYLTDSGHKLKLPIYYRNYIFSEEEREEMWIENIEKKVRYVLGEKIDVSKNDEVYMKKLKGAQKWNEKIGYGTDKKDWEKIKYENELRAMKHAKQWGA